MPNDGRNISVINERMMVAWHFRNPGFFNQFNLDGKLGDPISKSAWTALKKLNSPSPTIIQITELMGKNGSPGMTADKFHQEVLSFIDNFGLPDPSSTYEMLNGLWQRREGIDLLDEYRDALANAKITPQQAAEKIALRTALMYADEANFTSTDHWGGNVAKVQHKAMVDMSTSGRTPRFPRELAKMHSHFSKGILPGITSLMADTGAGKSIFRLMIEHCWAKEHGRQVISAITESSMIYERARRLCQLKKNLQYDNIVYGEWSDAYDEILGTPYSSGGAVHYVEANGKDIAWLMAVANGKDIVIDLIHDLRYDSFRLPGISDVKAEEIALSALEGYCVKHNAQVLITVQTDKAARVAARQGGVPLNAASAKGNSAYEGKARRFLTMQNKYATEEGSIYIEEDDVSLSWKPDQRIPLGYITMQKNRDGRLLRQPYYMVPGMFLLKAIPSVQGTDSISKSYAPYLPKAKAI